MKKDIKVNAEVQELREKALAIFGRLRGYGLAIFIIFVGIVYGVMLLRIQTLGNAQPTPDSVTSQVKAAQIPRIDPAIVQQLQSLQDNNVNVQALFNQARNNPFQQ